MWEQCSIYSSYFIDKQLITHRLIKNISPLSSFLRVISRIFRSECLQELQILLPSDFMTVLLSVCMHTIITLCYACCCEWRKCKYTLYLCLFWAAGMWEDGVLCLCWSYFTVEQQTLTCWIPGSLQLFSESRSWFSFILFPEEVFCLSSAKHCGFLQLISNILFFDRFMFWSNELFPEISLEMKITKS